MAGNDDQPMPQAAPSTDDAFDADFPDEAEPETEPAPDAAAWMPDGSVVDRRTGIDRRDSEDAGESSPLDRRRGPGRRLSDFTKAAEEGEMTREQFLFLVAIDEFKRANQKAFPTWTDILEVIRLLGYRKTMPSQLHLDRAEDWREPPNAPAGVRPDRWSERAA